MLALSKKITDLGYNIDSLTTATVAAFQQAVGGVAVQAQGEWIRIAQSRLHSSRAMYVDGLRSAESMKSEVVDGQPAFTIQLVGKMPNDIEFGMPSFDMKEVTPGWLGGGKAKVSKDGHRYVVVPFRHSTSSNTNIAYTGQAKAQNMQAELRKTVRNYGLDRMVRAASGSVVTGTVSRVPNNAPDVHRFLRGLARIQEAFNTSTSAGLQRGASTLMTFRIMSDKSAPDAWIHPGLPGVNLLNEVSNWTDQQLNGLIERIMGAAA